ncbi:MAG TPA: DUF559 domain-containing protein [Candidatus Thermoplasmatota archaeon]|nr:DUF559 domain-containing protein [Candidatus Thermoplasmatota archaeon]
MYPDRTWARILFADRLRRNPTEAMVRSERYMADRFGRDPFRRERVVGERIADFYFPLQRVVVEVDGPSHDNIDQWVKDRFRDLEMSQRGLLVLRSRNSDVFERAGWVMARVEAAVQARSQI